MYEEAIFFGGGVVKCSLMSFAEIINNGFVTAISIFDVYAPGSAELL